MKRVSKGMIRHFSKKIPYPVSNLDFQRESLLIFLIKTKTINKWDHSLELTERKNKVKQ